VLLTSACTSSTLHIDAPQPAGAVRELCARLVNHLPPKLDGNGSRVVEPRSPLVHAWGSPPVVLRCGVDRPTGFDPESAQVTVVQGISWFQQLGSDDVTWTAVRERANVELIVPTSYEGQGGMLVELAPAIKASIP
jgi:hypothetical protein